MTRCGMEPMPALPGVTRVRRLWQAFVAEDATLVEVNPLARLAGDPAATPATRDAIEVTFQTLNRYLGVAVGEHLGYLFTGLWTALAGIALIQSDLLHPLFGIVGLLLAPLFVLGSLEFVGPFEVRGWKLAGTLVPLAYIGWSVWLLALGIGLLLTA